MGSDPEYSYFTLPQVAINQETGCQRARQGPQLHTVLKFIRICGTALPHHLQSNGVFLENIE